MFGPEVVPQNCLNILYQFNIPKGAVDFKMVVILKIILSLVIYTFRGHIRAYKKANEILFEIIYTLWFVGVVSLLCR